MRDHRLSTGQIDAFFEDGYVVVPSVFGRPEVARMRCAFDRLRRMAANLEGTCMFRGAQFVLGGRDDAAAAGGSPPIHRVVWCGAAVPLLSGFGRDPRLLNMAAQLLGSTQMNQLINQAHFKLPGDGVAFPWHQDSRHRRYGTAEWCDVNGLGSYVQTVTAIDEVTEENGPLRVIPGSNRRGHVELPEGVELPSWVDPADARSLPMAPGSVLLFGPYTFHGSLPNRSARPRRVFINGYAFPGANSRRYPGEGAGRLLSATLPSAVA